MVDIVTCPPQHRVTSLADNASDAHYYYLVTVLTCMMTQAGTTAYVSICMTGDKGPDAKHRLDDNNIVLFQVGSKDWFFVAEKGSLGILNTIDVWVDYSDTSPAWFLNQITVRDTHTNKIWHFGCDKWLNPVEQSNIATCNLELSETQGFRYIFRVMPLQSLRDQYIWVSIFTCPQHSTFTRVQRVSCGFSVILSSMLTNIIFYRAKSTAHGSLVYSEFTINYDTFIIGMQSAIIIMPINMLILFIFRKVAPRERAFYVRFGGSEETFVPDRSSSYSSITHGSNSNENDFEDYQHQEPNISQNPIKVVLIAVITTFICNRPVKPTFDVTELLDLDQYTHSKRRNREISSRSGNVV
ncbi:Polycystic kidney disease protein 1-like 2 [Lamellibrachia satsuma]|nr:Polycystic kidney disease protein 1-like 2 [Lamellibrachia satsuma]